MKALVYPAFDELAISERPKPEPAEGEVLLRVEACGICGSELESFKTRSPRRTPPLVMGHEFCGEITALGPGAVGFSTGQKVISNSIVSCGECVRCRRGDTHLCGRRQIFGMHRSGAFAEYVNVPARVLIPWPEHLPSKAACLAEPLANGVHMVNLTRHLEPKNVLVIGCGPIGLFAVQAFRELLGADVYAAELHPVRREVARGLGASLLTGSLVEEIQSATEGEGADLVIDAVGAAETKRQSIAAARPGGAAVWIGLHENEMRLNSYDVTLSERQVFGSYTAAQAELEEAVRLLAEGRISVDDWVKTFPLDEGVEAFRRMLAAEGNDIKAVLQP